MSQEHPDVSILRAEATTEIPEPRELEVTAHWGDALLDVRHLDERDLGQASTEEPASAGLSLALARCTELGPGDRLRVTIGALSWSACWVPAQDRVEAPPRARDFRFAKIVTTSLMTCSAFVAAFFMTDTNAFALSDDVFKGVEHWSVVVKTPNKQHKRPIELPPKREQTKPRDRLAQTSKDQKPGAIDPLKKEHDRQRVMHSGLLDLLGGTSGASTNIFNSSGIGTRLNEAIDSLKSGDSQVADAHGLGAMGSRGSGPGGPGGLGLSGVGTRDGGRGGGPGHSPFGITLGDGDHRRPTTVLPPRTTVVGGCERSVIARTISRHMNEVRFCYETQLNINQSLAGKIAVSFTIDTAGAVSQADVAQTTMNDNTVEQCILARVRRWRFPEPKGGVCVINYPWVFHPAGETGEGAE
jgi:hypothetical protein